MKFEWLGLVIIISLLVVFSVTKRWVRWPFRLRTLYWCGGFSYLLLLGLPRIVIWPSADTEIRILFTILVAVIFSWILAYHQHDDSR